MGPIFGFLADAERALPGGSPKIAKVYNRIAAAHEQANTDHTAPPCTIESHAAIKADPKRWDALPSIGSSTYEFEEGSIELHDMRNCNLCGSTLVKIAREKR